MKISENIKKYRKMKGMTQKQLADAIGVSVQAISKWECGATPDITQIQPLCRALGASANELLGYADQMKEIDEGWYTILRNHGEGSLVAIEYEKKVLSEFPNDLTYGYRLATDYHIHSQMCETPREKHYYLQLAKVQFEKLLEKDPTDEIVRSCNRLIAAGVKEADEQSFAAALDTACAGDPDLIVRTGGDLRISNFLLWQAAYAELYFTDVLWPDFGAAEIDKAVEAFYKRKRRFGGV